MSLAHALPLPPLAPRRAPPAAPRRADLRAVPRTTEADRRLRAGRLYRELGPTVYRRCRRLLRDREAAADATQEVFLRLVQQGEALAERQDLLPWLCRVATNHCLNVIRDARGHAEAPLEDADEPSVAPFPSSLGDRLVRRVLAQFDEVTQVIAVGFIVEGMEAEELARQLGVSRRTISRKLDRFLAQARRQLTAGPRAAAR